MAKIKDIRSRTKRSNGTRKVSQIKHIVRHHSATKDGNFDTFWNHWNGTKKWGTGGYHEIILRDGTVELCYDPTEITNGVGSYNTPTYHICLVGNGSFTEAQEEAWEERAKYNMKRLGIPLREVKGHNEMPGANTECPGISMAKVRNSLTNGNEPANTTKYKPKANLTVDGWWGKKLTTALQIYFGTPVDGELWGQYRNDVAVQITSGLKYGKGGSTVIKALQRYLNSKGFNLVVDGVLGKATIIVLQTYLGTPVDGEIWSPSKVIKELQRRLNNGNL